MAPPSVLIHALLYQTVSTPAPNALGLCLPAGFTAVCSLVGQSGPNAELADKLSAFAPTHTDETRAWGLLLFILLAYLQDGVGEEKIHSGNVLHS